MRGVRTRNWCSQEESLKDSAGPPRINNVLVAQLNLKQNATTKRSNSARRSVANHQGNLIVFPGEADREILLL